MKHFLHIRDIPFRDLKRIISDAKYRKSKRGKYYNPNLALFPMLWKTIYAISNLLFL